ncbi:MAG: HD domain-containing protein [Planctomycetes bacterium]|nr:HD domain-containing protein [Planctomycetota bacterium]
MDARAALLLKQVQTLSEAGLGRAVERPAQSVEELLGSVAGRAGVRGVGLYLATADGILHWRGERLSELVGVSASQLDDAATGLGARAYASFDGEGDLVGALVLRGEADELDAVREDLSQHLQAELTQRGYLSAVFALAEAVEEQDEAIAGHVRRISGYSAVIARAHGCEPEFVRAVQLASPLHDVGKVAIPSEILFKPGKLSDAEFDETKRHSAEGAAILARGGGAFWALAAEVAGSHHERWDGSGYPRGLSGEAIPLAARIVAVADVFDALTTKRIYKPALGIEQSLNIISEGSGRHFDPELVDAFQRSFSEILDVKTRETSA